MAKHPNFACQIFGNLVGRGGVAKSNTLIIFLLAGVSWGLWKNRNAWIFSDLLIKNVKSLAYKILGYIQLWRKLERKEDAPTVEELIKKLQEGLDNW